MKSFKLKHSQDGFFDIMGLLIGAVVFVFFAFMVIYLFAGGLPTIRYIFSLLLKTFHLR